MLHFRVYFGLPAVLFCACLVQAAGEPSSAPAASPTSTILPLRYQIMVKVCSLSDEQQRQIAELERAFTQTMDDFLSTHAEELRKSDAAIAEATSRGDQTALKEARQAHALILQPLEKTAKGHYEDVIAVLDLKQRLLWQEHLVISVVKAKFLQAGLTDEQLTRMKAAYAEIAADTTLKPVDIERKLTSSVELTLDEKQRQRLTKGK